MGGVVIVAVWQGIAFNTILYLAGLQTIPTSLYEASNLDGAGKWREFWSITFPLIAPFLRDQYGIGDEKFPDGVRSDRGFDEWRAGSGHPVDFPPDIHRGFKGGEFAYQSANSVIYFIVIAIISILQLRFLQRREMDN